MDPFLDTFEDFVLDTFEDDRLEDEAREWATYLEDVPPYAEAAPSAVRESILDYAAELGLSLRDPDEGASIEAAVERAAALLGGFRGSVSDLKARAILHAPPKARRSVGRITRTASHSLAACDYPAFLEALATGQVKALRDRAAAELDRLTELSARTRVEAPPGELERFAFIGVVCDLALEAISERDPERLRKAEKALRTATRTGSQTRTRAYSRPRRRGPCSRPSRHLTQATRRTHAPPRSSGRQPRERGGLTPLA